jgi:hypothetical protein
MDRGLPDVEWLITLQHKVDAAYRPFNSQHVVQLPWLCYKIDAFTSSLTKLPHRSTTRKGLKMSNSPQQQRTIATPGAHSLATQPRSRHTIRLHHRSTRRRPQYGHQADRVVAHARQHGQYQMPAPEVQTKQSVTWARDHVFERSAVQDRRTILETALARAMGGTTYARIRQEFELRIEAGEFREVPRVGAGRRYTTAVMIRMVREIIGRMQEGNRRVWLPKTQSELETRKSRLHADTLCRRN